jgi:hypothetical protein
MISLGDYITNSVRESTYTIVLKLIQMTTTKLRYTVAIPEVGGYMLWSPSTHAIRRVAMIVMSDT